MTDKIYFISVSISSFRYNKNTFNIFLTTLWIKQLFILIACISVLFIAFIIFIAFKIKSFNKKLKTTKINN